MHDEVAVGFASFGHGDEVVDGFGSTPCCDEDMLLVVHSGIEKRVTEKCELTSPNKGPFVNEQVAIVLPFRRIAVNGPTFAYFGDGKAIEKGGHGAIVGRVDSRLWIVWCSHDCKGFGAWRFLGESEEVKR
jgi:hypothetical protein